MFYILSSPVSTFWPSSSTLHHSLINAISVLILLEAVLDLPIFSINKDQFSESAYYTRSSVSSLPNSSICEYLHPVRLQIVSFTHLSLCVYTVLVTYITLLLTDYTKDSVISQISILSRISPQETRTLVRLTFTCTIQLVIRYIPISNSLPYILRLLYLLSVDILFRRLN